MHSSLTKEGEMAETDKSKGNRRRGLVVFSILLLVGVGLTMESCGRVYDAAKASHDAKAEAMAAERAGTLNGKTVDGSTVKAVAEGKTLNLTYDLGLKDGERLSEIRRSTLLLDWRANLRSEWCSDFVKAGMTVKATLVAGADRFDEVVDKAACDLGK